MNELYFAVALLVDGILVGFMYSLIAIGFVLIYKATGAINFAQGEFVMFAGITAAAFVAAGFGFWVALALTLVVMVTLSVALERIVLRPLIGRSVISVVMATIGVAAVIRGLGPLIFGIGTRSIPLPFSDRPLLLGSVMIPRVQLAGGGISIAFVLGLTWFFARTRTGIAMRAVADSQTVASAMGINVPRYFAFAWALAGIVSAVGGVLWGALLGADNQLAVIGMKVFPIVILGGLDSIAGAVVAGIIVGVLENFTAGYLDQYVGGGMKDLAPYMVMVVVLMFRPYGLFGKRQVERI